MSSPKHEFNDGDNRDAGGWVPYLPLSEDPAADSAEGASIGSLVKDATQHMSTLFRAELELAKTETVGEVKKATKGSIFFIIAAVVALYSSFFFFFFLGELLSEWLQRWAAFGIVFLLMLVFAGICGFVGYRKFKKVRAPQRSIDSIKESAATLKPQQKPAGTADGMPRVPGEPQSRS
ncbi:phage holin family protein [Prauserella halophila]|uniref:Phage holin family protein n=1 Tax=Prauserella halophila TaxID=185641 RepID=A0ABN1W7P1_9PSEU|nr:phage holin family protein [Prauserella halophila]MCP2235451.1 putative Holin-X, holin superfamily III [Prauserella halophila]